MSKSLRALRERRATLLRETDDLFATIDREGRAMSAAEAAADDARIAEVAEIDATLQRAEAHDARMRTLGGLGTGGERPGNNSGFASLGEQLMAVARAGQPSGQRDPRLVYVDGLGSIQAGPTGLGESVDAEGGFLIDQTYVGDLMKPIWDNGAIASRIRRLGIGPNSNGIKMNGVDETSRANGSRWGGIRAFWTGEAALINASAPRFKKVQMELEKLTGICYATSEVLRDATALSGWISQAFNDEFEFKIEDAIMNGPGAGAPLGYLNSGAVITQTKEASQASGTILSPNITKMWSRMPPRNRRNAVWLINQDVEPQLFTLNVPVKNVAGTENVGGFQSPAVIYVPPGTNGNEYGLLMGKPVIPVEYAASIGTAGDIQLVDLSQYLGIDKDGIDQQMSLHVRFLYDEQTFRFILRFNGQPLWTSPVTPYKGSNTVSPFVILESR